jgi:hypothetical protein
MNKTPGVGVSSRIGGGRGGGGAAKTAAFERSATEIGRTGTGSTGSGAGTAGTTGSCAAMVPGNPSESKPVPCPPASVYTKWAHVSYSGTAGGKRQGTSNRKSAVGATASWTCTVYASDPFWEDTGYVIGGEGAQFCSGAGWAPQRIRVAIETYLGLGFWEIRVRDGTSWSYSDSSDYTVYWDCAGSGTQTYRVVVDGYAQGGNAEQSVQSENDPRWTCY